MRWNIVIAAMIIAMRGIAFADDVSTTRPDAVDLGTPQAAVISYFQATERHDAAAAKEAAVRSPKIDQLIDTAIAEDTARQEYLEAAKKKFGANAVNVPDVISILIEDVKNSKVHETGDTADIGDHGDYPCRKVDGKWKFDLVRQNSDAAQLDAAIRYLIDSAAAYEKFTPQVSGGNWKSFEEMDQARAAAAPMPPPPPEPKG